MKPPYSPKPHLGVNTIEQIILQFGWIFRRTPDPDLGIDAVFEIAINGLTSALVGEIQIKTGDSNFKKNKDGFTYYASERHFEYWTSLRNPVFLFGVLDNGSIIYQYLSLREDYKKKGKSYSIFIPRNQCLGEGAKEKMVSLVKNHVARYDTVVFASYSGFPIDFLISEFNLILGHFTNSVSKAALALDIYAKEAIALTDFATKFSSSHEAMRLKMLSHFVDKHVAIVNQLANDLNLQFSHMRAKISEIEGLISYLLENKALYIHSEFFSSDFLQSLSNAMEASSMAKESLAAPQKTFEEFGAFNSKVHGEATVRAGAIVYKGGEVLLRYTAAFDTLRKNIT